MQDIENKETKELQNELELLYEQIEDGAIVSKIVELEIELERRCNR